MIGRDYTNTMGNKKHAIFKFGDGRGVPYEGPIQVCYLKYFTYAVLSKKTGSIYIQSLRGFIQHIYYSTIISLELYGVEDPTERVKQFIDSDDERDSSLDPNNLPSTTCIEFHPVDICKVPQRNVLAVADKAMSIHLLDLESHQIIDTFGVAGFKFGELVSPLSIASTYVPSHGVFYFVGDGLDNQKIHVYNQELAPVLDMGGYGLRKCEFRDVISISCYSPFREDTYEDKLSNTRNDHHHHHHYHSSSHHNHVIDIPKWYKGEQSYDDLETMLYDDNEDYLSNFVVGKRKDTSSDDDSSIYDLLFLTKSGKMERWTIKESVEPRRRTQYYISNSLLSLDKKVLYPSLIDLIISQRGLYIRSDPRQYVLVAAVDKDNYRIQIFKFYYTDTFIYTPKMQFIHVIGGPKNRYIELMKPTAVSYSPTGELAICDVGLRRVIIMSITMNLIKWFNIPFENPSSSLFTKSSIAKGSKVSPVKALSSSDKHKGGHRSHDDNIVIKRPITSDTVSK
jgi:hypothetical protein